MIDQVREKASIVTVQPRVQHRTDAPAPNQPAQPAPKRQEKPKKIVKPATEKKVSAPVATGILAGVIAQAKAALNPGKLTTLEQMGAHFRAKNDPHAQALAATIGELLAKTGAANAGPSPELAATVEALSTSTKAMETITATLATFKPTSVQAADELLKLRAKKSELEAREKQVKSDSARYAGLSGRANKATDAEKKAQLETERDALKASIDAEKAAIASERGQHGDDGRDLKFCEDIALFHQDETPSFAECVEAVTERNRLAADHAQIVAAHEEIAPPSEVLAEQLGNAVAGYQARIEELTQAK